MPDDGTTQFSPEQIRALKRESSDGAAFDATTVSKVQSSWAKVMPISDAAAKLFYDRLFELDPSLRPLFKSDMAEQRKKLMKTLAVAVDGLNDVPRLLPVLKDLGVRHAGYMVQEPHYDTVGAALLWTLGEGLGDAFTADVEAAWTKVYGVIATVMKDAARDAAQSAPTTAPSKRQKRSAAAPAAAVAPPAASAVPPNPAPAAAPTHAVAVTSTEPAVRTFRLDTARELELNVALRLDAGPLVAAIERARRHEPPAVDRPRRPEPRVGRVAILSAVAGASATLLVAGQIASSLAELASWSTVLASITLACSAALTGYFWGRSDRRDD